MASKEQAFSYFTNKGFSRQNRFYVLIALPPKLQEKLNEERESEEEGGSIFQSILSQDNIGFLNPFGSGDTDPSMVRTLDIMCEQASFPGRAFETTDVKYNADYTTIPYAITYQPISFTFLVSQDFVERNFFDQWQELIVNPYTHTVSYFSEIASPGIEIGQLDTIDNTVFKSMVVDAFPSNVQTMPLDNTANNSIHRMTVEFTFRRFENNQIDTDDTVDALSQTPLGPFTTPILSNPMVSSALDFVENQTGLDLEGEAVAVYNQVDQVLQNTTGESVNQSVSLLNSIKASLGLTGDMTPEQVSQLTKFVDDAIKRLGG